MKFTIIVSAEFPNLTPSHKRFISKTGEGSSLLRAVKDGISKVFDDDAVKGKRVGSLMPIKWRTENAEEEC